MLSEGALAERWPDRYRLGVGLGSCAKIGPPATCSSATLGMLLLEQRSGAALRGALAEDVGAGPAHQVHGWAVGAPPIARALPWTSQLTLAMLVAHLLVAAASQHVKVAP